MEEKFLVDPKWIASLYGLSATAACVLIFTYSNTDFSSALLKTFFTSFAFYLIGIVVSSVINFVLIMRRQSEKEEETEEKETESRGETKEQVT